MQKLGGWFARWTERLLPDPMVIVCLLTIGVVLFGVLAPSHADLAAKPTLSRVAEVSESWFNGVWSAGFLTFALQMCMVLLTGYGLAKAPPAVRMLRRVAAMIRTNRGAVLCVTAVSCIGCWVNWGFGLIAAGILATELRRELTRRGQRFQYALIVAGAYSGMMIWHGGLSGSAPLKIAGEGVSFQDTSGERIEMAPINIRRTVFSTGNLVLTACLVIGIPLVLGKMASGPGADYDGLTPIEDECEPEQTVGRSLADSVNRSRIVPILTALVAAIAIGHLLYTRGSGAVDLNFINTVFLVAGLLLHRNLSEYVAAVAEGGRAVTGIVIQFPLYSGLQAVMKDAGLAAAISSACVDLSHWGSTALGLSAGVTFPTTTFLGSGLLNLFVPSGGGQWIVQKEIICNAGEALSLPIEQTVMAFSYGDQWTNMIQPFWAIPLMGLTGVNVRQFMGYCVLLMLLSLPVFLLGLVLLF